MNMAEFKNIQMDYSRNV